VILSRWDREGEAGVRNHKGLSKDFGRVFEVYMRYHMQHVKKMTGVMDIICVITCVNTCDMNCNIDITCLVVFDIISLRLLP